MLTVLVAAAITGCGGGADPDGTATPDTAARSTDDTAAMWSTVQIAQPLTTIDFDGFKSHYWVPDAPVGLCFVFHGSDSTVDAVLQIEWIELYNEWMDRDIAFVMTGSTDRQDGRWDHSDADPATNDDFSRLAALRAQLIADTALSETTPTCSLGFSGGASMANFFGALALDSGWDFRAFSMHNSSGYSRPIAADGLFVSAANDPTSPPDTLEGHTQTCRDAGNRCEHFRGEELALPPLRFTKSPQYGRDASQQMFDELVTLQFIDAAGWRLPAVAVSTLEDVDATITSYEAQTVANSPFDAGQQLRVVWATHRLTAQFKVAEADFFLEALTR